MTERRLCPSCRSEIDAQAATCARCGLAVRRSRAEMMIAAVSVVTRGFRIELPSSDCAVRCHSVFKDDPAGRQQCLDDCAASAAIAELAARLHQKLAKDFFEVIWTRGNIDPVPELVKQVVQRFGNEPLGR